ncbi:MAG: helix-turn-helix transcriptional regulator [bacterium]|nr:helix-turn-helix transcriptional regulator [bacterium]
MSFGKRLLEVRKKKKLSQEDIAEYLKTKAPVVGRYEREEMRPSIDVALKISELLDTSLDYLLGKIDTELEKETYNRILEVSKFDKKDRDLIFSVIDAFIAKKKIQSIL